jgi:hypothetical protein
LRAELQGGHPAAPERYFERALIGGASADRPMLDSLHASPYVRASRWHSPTWSANSLTDRAYRSKT